MKDGDDADVELELEKTSLYVHHGVKIGINAERDTDTHNSNI